MENGHGRGLSVPNEPRCRPSELMGARFAPAFKRGCARVLKTDIHTRGPCPWRSTANPIRRLSPIASRGIVFPSREEAMSLQDDVLKAYHRAVARHCQRTGECYPLVRASCVNDKGTIIDTNVHWP